MKTPTFPHTSATEINSFDPIKLDLACGQTPREGFEGVDAFAPNAKYKIDLLQFPWPWADSSVDEIYCSHFIEHIPMAEINGKDLLFAFFDECYRILKPKGQMTVRCPNARSNAAFQDPTHRRFIVAETFGYFSKEWREGNKISHYNVSCNFAPSVRPLLPATSRNLGLEELNKLINQAWNVVIEWEAVLIAIK